MSLAWLIFALCIVVVLGAALPLIHERRSGRTPPLPRKETLRDWRNEG